MKTKKYGTLQGLIEDCQKNGMHIVKVSQWFEGIGVTACSVKSPILRVWKSKPRKYEECDSLEEVILRLEINNLWVSEGEWTVEILRELGLK